MSMTGKRYSRNPARPSAQRKRFRIRITQRRRDDLIAAVEDQFRILLQTRYLLDRSAI